MTRRKSMLWLALAAIIVAVALAIFLDARPTRRGGDADGIANAPAPVPRGRATVAHRLKHYGPPARARLRQHFDQCGVSYPPAKVVFVGIKDTRRLELWAASDSPRYALVRTYPILGASGRLGPKLREGDLQVPEGLYLIESLNPNSLYHLSLRLNYPNDFDRRKGRLDRRSNPGGDIMIHGNTCSVGCLAMGDEAAEDLFVVAADTKLQNIRVILTPVDFRVAQLPADMPASPEWTAELYEQIRAALKQLRP